LLGDRRRRRFSAGGGASRWPGGGGRRGAGGRPGHLSARQPARRHGLLPGEEDPSKIVHQASIAETTRQCTLSGGEIVIEVAAAGRLLVGPAGSTGAVTMPIRVVAVRGDEVLYSELTSYQATLDQTSDQFLFTDPNVRIPAAGAEGVQLFVGFDEGPYDTP
jgi:hypothetical protein